MQQESQNIKPKYYCQLPAKSTALAPISLAGCDKLQGSWIQVPSWGLPAPECITHGTSRDNHLGNVVVQDFAGHPQPVTSHYIWTIPEALRGKQVDRLLSLQYY
jgi:hypothetical protein